MTTQPKCQSVAADYSPEYYFAQGRVTAQIDQLRNELFEDLSYAASLTEVEFKRQYPRYKNPGELLIKKMAAHQKRIDGLWARFQIKWLPF